MLTTPQTVIDRARSLWYVSSNQYTDTIALEDYNIIRQLLSNYIMSSVNEWFFDDVVKTAAVVWQNEYTLTDDTNNIRINKISDVFIKYKTGEEYQKASKIDQDWPTDFINYTGLPIYYIEADSVFIYPAIENIDVAEGVKINVSLTPVDLIISAADTLFPREHKNVISLWMIPLIYQRRGMMNESNNAKAIFENAKLDMIGELTDRVNVPETVTFPDLSYYD